MASARASEALNKGSRRVLLWVAEPSSQNILATSDLAKDVALEHLTVDDMNAVLGGFQGTATVQNVCVVVRHENSAVLTSLRTNAHWKAARAIVIYDNSSDTAPVKPSANPRTTVAGNFDQALDQVKAWITRPPSA